MNGRFAVPGIDARTPLANAAPALLLAKADPFFELEEAARSGADADAIHDMRVASRRLRETLRLLAPLYPRARFDSWYRKVRRVTSALGPVRDSDVFIDYFSHLGDDLAEGPRRAIAFLIGQRMGLREGELAALNKHLGRLDLSGNRASFTKFARLATHSPSADRPLAEFAHAAIAERAATVFGAQLPALAEENVAEQHALRIDYKRLRYAAEVFAPCYGNEFHELHRTLTAFQDTLGDLHDTHVFLATLRQPSRVADANRAGVLASDLDGVATLLEARAHEGFVRFADLADANPSERLLPELLLPLSRRPATPVSPDDVAIVEPSAEAAVVSPVNVGDEPWVTGWDESGLREAVRPLDTGDASRED